MLSLDTNILVYAADIAAGHRHAAAQRLIDAASHVEAALTEQSIFEFVYVVTRKAKQSQERAFAIARALLDTFPLLTPASDIVRAGLALARTHKIGIWDARLLTVCAASGCTHLMSEDMQDGAVYNGVTVIDPFATKNAMLVKELLST